MDLGLQGKVAMVAAGSKGIGRAVAEMLLREGCKVSVCGRTLGTLEEVFCGLDDVLTTTCDVTKAEDLERWVGATLDAFGTPSILVTNTGGPPAGALNQKTDAEWQLGVDATLMNVVRLTRQIGPMMAAQEWGRIVHITSLVAKEPSLLLPISSTLRAGLMALTRVQATELAPHGVTVNSVLPGHTLTDRQLHLARIRADQKGIDVEQALQLQANEVPMKRLAEPPEIAAAVVFLCSQQASYITGTNLLVDGGLTKSLG